MGRRECAEEQTTQTARDRQPSAGARAFARLWAVGTRTGGQDEQRAVGEKTSGLCPGVSSSNPCGKRRVVRLVTRFVGDQPRPQCFGNLPDGHTATRRPRLVDCRTGRTGLRIPPLANVTAASHRSTGLAAHRARGAESELPATHDRRRHTSSLRADHQPGDSRRPRGRAREGKHT